MTNNKIDTIIEYLKSLTLIEISFLTKALEEVFGITNLNSNINSESINKVSSEEVLITNEVLVEEKNTFNIILNEVPATKKIPILKIVRNMTGYGLKESKELIDTVPKVIKSDLSKEQCEQFKKELEDAGAKITIQ